MISRACVCGGIVRDGNCNKCGKQREERLSAAKRGYDRRWRGARARYLANNPLCVACIEGGRSIPATVVDHIVPHRGERSLFWSVDNWQALCVPCHAMKTARGE